MARIRTIKPEFPQSESMGRVSRDARLLFVLLWTVADDSGRARASSRLLASLLYPYDDDAPRLIDGWLEELEAEECVVRYEHEGSTYLQVCKWLNHQKIDKPTPSRLPSPDEGSRILARPRESSPPDLGPRTLDLGPRTGTGTGTEDRGQPAASQPATLTLTPSPAPAPAAPKNDSAATAANIATWEAYRDGYYVRYKADPVDNAKVRSQIAAFVKRIGREEAAHVARWFPTHPGRYYVERGHAVDCLLADAEKLRTEWATRRVTTSSQAAQGDRVAGTLAAAQNVIADLEATE